MKTPTIIVHCAFLMCLVAIPSVSAKAPNEKQELSGEEIRKLLVDAPTPPYPSAYRARRLEGTGSYWLHFNAKSDSVDAVKYGVKIIAGTGDTGDIVFNDRAEAYAEKYNACLLRHLMRKHDERLTMRCSQPLADVRQRFL